MKKYCLIWTVVAVCLASIGILALVLFVIDTDEETVLESQFRLGPTNLSVAPPEPVFIASDNSACQAVLTEYWEFALNRFRYVTE